MLNATGQSDVHAPKDRFLRDLPEYHTRRVREAIQTLEEVVAELEGDPNRTDTDMSRIRVALGLSYQAAQYPEKAFEQFLKAVELDPLNEEAMNCLWNLTEVLGRQTQFLQLTLRLLESHPSVEENPVLWAYRGRVLSQQKEYDQALVSFHKSLALDPNRPKTYELLYEALEPMCEFDPDARINIFVELCQRYPEVVYPSEYLWREYRKRAKEDNIAPESRIRYLETALETYKVAALGEQDLANAHFQLAEMYSDLAEAHRQVGDNTFSILDKAIDLYQKTLPYLPPFSDDRVRLHLKLSDSYHERGFLKESGESLQQAEEISRKIDSKSSPAHLLDIGLFYQRKSEDLTRSEPNDADKADYYFGQFLEGSGLANSETYGYLGDIYTQKQNYSESARAFRMALKASEVYGTSDEDYRYRLGEALLRNGQVEESIVELNKAIDSKANQAKVHLELARAHHKIGQIQKADDHIKAARALELAVGIRSDIEETARSICLTLWKNRLLNWVIPALLGILVIAVFAWLIYYYVCCVYYENIRFRRGSPEAKTFEAAKDLELRLRELVQFVALTQYGKTWADKLTKELADKDRSMIEECKRIMSQRSWQGDTFLDAIYFRQLIDIVNWKWEDWFQFVFNKKDRREVLRDFDRINEGRNRAAHHRPMSEEDADVIQALVKAYTPDIDVQLKLV